MLNLLTKTLPLVSLLTTSSSMFLPGVLAASYAFNSSLNEIKKTHEINSNIESIFKLNIIKKNKYNIFKNNITKHSRQFYDYMFFIQNSGFLLEGTPYFKSETMLDELYNLNEINKIDEKIDILKFEIEDKQHSENILKFRDKKINELYNIASNFKNIINKT
jgi:hypothetical protein